MEPSDLAPLWLAAGLLGFIVAVAYMLFPFMVVRRLDKIHAELKEANMHLMISAKNSGDALRRD